MGMGPYFQQEEHAFLVMIKVKVKVFCSPDKIQKPSTSAPA